jgi:hypothetical protein
MLTEGRGLAAGSGTWLVSVPMVSDGVDVPRLRVGVYATSARTELFFRQVVGRFVRRTPVPKDQMSHLFLPSDPTRKRLASEIEEERDHALMHLAEGEAVERGERTKAGDAFRALWSSARRDDDVLHHPARRGAPALRRGGARAGLARARRLHHDRARAGERVRAPRAPRSSRRSPAAPARPTARSTRASTARSACGPSPTRRQRSSSARTRCSSV